MTSLIKNSLIDLIFAFVKKFRFEIQYISEETCRSIVFSLYFQQIFSEFKSSSQLSNHKRKKEKSNILHVILVVKVLLVDLAQHKIKRNEFDHLIQTLNKYVC